MINMQVKIKGYSILWKLIYGLNKNSSTFCRAYNGSKVKFTVTVT